jgi:hypothetical protein
VAAIPLVFAKSCAIEAPMSTKPTNPRTSKTFGKKPFYRNTPAPGVQKAKEFQRSGKPAAARTPERVLVANPENDLIAPRNRGAEEHQAKASQFVVH